MKDTAQEPTEIGESDTHGMGFDGGGGGMGIGGGKGSDDGSRRGSSGGGGMGNVWPYETRCLMLQTAQCMSQMPESPPPLEQLCKTDKSNKIYDK